MEEERVICIGEEEAGGRLDSVLSGFFDDISRSRAAGLIREGSGVAAEALSEHFGFVNVVASGGVGVDFLIENKVGFLVQRGLSNAVCTVLDALLRVSPRLGSAVHKECEIGSVRAESRNISERGVFFADFYRIG